MVEKIVIPKGIYEKMIGHGEDMLPYEACGMLSGNNNNIKSIWPFRNEAKSTNRFFVSKNVIIETLRKIALKKEEVIAIYHTHPLTKPIPSRYDLAHHIDEDVKMVIVSYRAEKPVAKCFRIVDKSYEECLFLVEL